MSITTPIQSLRHSPLTSERVMMDGTMAIQAQSLVRRQTPNPPSHHLRSDSDSSDKKAAFQAALRNTGYGELTRVRLDIDDAVVTLFGEVSSFYMKQLAQEAIRPLSIGMQIDNQVHVPHRLNSPHKTE